jgi:arylsulfatase A-like enzyme/uncharacterized membrane protein
VDPAFPSPRPTRPELRYALVLTVLAWALRLVFALRRPELSREIGDTLMGLARGFAFDAALGAAVGSLAGLVHRAGAGLVAKAGTSAWVLFAALVAGVETEYFAFSRNRLDATFVAYAREWRVLGGSVAGEASRVHLAGHLALAAFAGVSIWRTVHVGRRFHAAPALLLPVSCALVLWLGTHVRQASTWFGDEVSRHPLLGLAKALQAGEGATVSQAAAGDVEAARRFTNPLGIKQFPDNATPLAHRETAPRSGLFAPPPRPLNFVYVMLEGMEAASLRASGGTAGLAPELDDLAEKNIYFKNFYANGAHTPRALDASLCSLVPRLAGAPLSRAQPRMPVRCLPGVLRDAGYATGFVHGGMEAFENRFEFLGRIGFRDTVFFEQFGRHLPTSNGGWGATDAQTYEQALGWLDRRDRGAPFFLTVLSISNHHPFHVPDPALELDHDEALLPNNTVRYADREVGRFVRALGERGLLQDTVVFLFGDHGLTRSNVNADPGAASVERLLSRANVPLVVLGPPAVMPAHQVVERLASQDDLMPTVLDLAAMDVPTHAVGHSLGYALGPAGRDLPVLVHDLYSGLVADVRPGAVEIASVGERGQADGSWSWQRAEGGRVQAERATPDEARRAQLLSVTRAVDAAYATERWWSPSLAADRR